MMSLSRGTLWTGLLVLFLAGALTGAVGTALYSRYGDEQRWDRGPAARQERIMNRLTQELSLSPAQRSEIDPIVARAYLDLLRLRVSHQPDVDRIFGVGMGEIKAKVSPEQQAKLDLLYAHLQRRWRMNGEYVRQGQDTAGRKD